jgi:hypothetical protein
MSFTSDFPRETGESYTSLNEAKGSESFKGFVALIRRMNKYRREALAAFANPSNARAKDDLTDIFKYIGGHLGRRSLIPHQADGVNQTRR